MPARPALDYAGRMKLSPYVQEAVMARLLHIAFGTLLLSLAGASTYVLCSEDILLEQTTLFLMR